MRRAGVKRKAGGNPYERKVTPLNQTFLDALASISRERGGRISPLGPSNSYNCQREIIFEAIDMPVSNPRLTSSTLAAEQGEAEEAVVRKVLDAAGYNVLEHQYHVSGESINCPDGGTIDFLVEINSERIIVDAKRLGLWRYLNLWQHGTKKGNPGYYTQLQLYMVAAEVSRSLLVAIPADYSAIRGVWTQRKYSPDTLPPEVYVEEIISDRNWQEASIKRNAETLYFIEQGLPHKTPRMFTPEETVFPCNYCSWKKACMEIGE